MDTDSRGSFLFQESRKKAEAKPQDHFEYDLYRCATEKYASLPIWEKQARSMADAIRNQDVLIEPYDRVIGRCYFGNPVPARVIDPDLLYNRSLSSPKHNLVPTEIFPEYQTLRHYQLVSEYIPGHVAWNWQTILANGTEGLRRRCEVGLQRRKNDAKSCEFYRGVLIMIDALEDWNDAHVAELERMGMTEQAEICRRVPRYPARSFREAVQAYYMQHLAVMKDGALLSNAGHFDVEIDKVALAKMAVRVWERKPNIMGYELPDGRVLNLLAEGRLVNLAAGNGHPAEIMDMSFALQAKGLEYLAQNRGKLAHKLYSVPRETDVAVARLKLESLGVSIDALTPEQLEYLSRVE